MRKTKGELGSTLDGIAVAMSVACILHCLLAPVLIILFPILGSSLFADHHFHALLLLFIIPTSLLALYLGCRQHGDGSVLWLGIGGICILTVAALLGPETLGGYGEKLVTGVGGLVLAAGHVQNFRRCRAVSCEEKAGCAAAQAASA